MLHSSTRLSLLVLRIGGIINRRISDDRGQSTAEYALLLLGVATIALTVVGWASGTGKIGELFDSVIDSIIGRV